MRKLAHAEALTQDITEHSCDLLVYQAINPPADVEGFLLRKEGEGSAWRSNTTMTSQARA